MELAWRNGEEDRRFENRIIFLPTAKYKDFIIFVPWHFVFILI
jgi:hypothetical protein